MSWLEVDGEVSTTGGWSFVKVVAWFSNTQWISILSWYTAVNDLLLCSYAAVSDLLMVIMKILAKIVTWMQFFILKILRIFLPFSANPRYPCTVWYLLDSSIVNEVIKTIWIFFKEHKISIFPLSAVFVCKKLLPLLFFVRLFLFCWLVLVWFTNFCAQNLFVKKR